MPSGRATRLQPNLAIDLRYEMQSDTNVTKKFRTVPKGYPPQIHVENRPVRLKWKESSSQSHCPYSPIKNHMIVHGYFNHMLGEFYERCFMGLVDMFLTSIRVSNATWDTLSTQTQLYLHLNTGDVSSLLTSHKMLMGALSTNPLYRLEDLLDGTQCRCLRRLILCGYQVLAESTHPELTLRPARHVGIQQHYFVDRTKKASPQYAAVRKFLRQRLVVGNPPMKENLIPAKRERIIREALQRANLSVPDGIDHTKWKIVGFSQRSIRRKWTNLDEILSYCLKYAQHNVACFEINLENPEFDSVSQHIQVHASVDALIGIHGASLTEAVLMPPGSTVVELLPWLYDSTMYGSWTTWVHRPTPLDTDLVHVGIPLPRNSSNDHCEAAVNKKKCFGKEPYRWDNRPFLLDPWFLFEKVVKKIILYEGSSCEGWIQSAGDDSVLYNIPCVDNNKPKIGHYYRDAQWLEEKRKVAGSSKRRASSQ
eukprot:Nitzschia sp. Nitz4//scaffold122_size67431//42624//44078//NITZ4_006088-RA/size67431-snap-gene-0.27-mRNA-1//-1//CDS//3329534412//2356//frame0